ncbi:MAG: bifunctional adenosylcobinamide kinase/adenosylcobinamide-phosphate guanylyltransferase [Rhodomicrobium sp.]
MNSKSAITLVLGGARSGKSAYAERLVTALPPPWVYCATAQALDGEMRERIAHHQARRTKGWTTVETPLGLAEVIATATRPILVDCLTLWLSNVMLAGKDIEAEMKKLLAAARASRAPIVFVSNEVGLGIVPDNALAREYRDRAGRLNQAVAAIANRAVFMVAGLPIELKDE